jgi:hypothetical protein
MQSVFEIQSHDNYDSEVIGTPLEFIRRHFSRQESLGIRLMK